MNSLDRFEKHIFTLGEQFSPSAVIVEDVKQLKGAKPDVVVLCGMGGSGIPAAVLQNIAEYANITIPLVSWHDFGLPALSSYRRPLFIFVSFSGDTEETLSSFELAHKAKLRAVVTSGGKLLDHARTEGIARAIVPVAPGILARQTSGALLYGVLSILQAVLTTTALPDLSNSLRPELFRTIGKDIARELLYKTVLIYTPTRESHIGQLIKIQLNESAKTPAFANTYPHINHFEISGFDRKPQHFVALLPASQHQNAITKKLLKIVRETLENDGVKTITVSIPGESSLEIVANSFILANWIGLELARLLNLDPSQNETVAKIKRKLRS